MRFGEIRQHERDDIVLADAKAVEEVGGGRDAGEQVIGSQRDEQAEVRRAAVEEAYQTGYFGERILGTDFACDVFVYRGAGSYVCGEASGLITE